MSSSGRRVYLTDLPLEEALSRWTGALRARGLLEPVPAETVDASDACGRVTAEAVCAARSVPHYHAAGMDGIAVRAEDTFGASETTPILLPPDRFVTVNTGDAMPQGADAVVMVEEIRDVGGSFEILAPAVPWQHVRSVGEDIIATELLLPQGHLIRAVDVGAMAAAGVTAVMVRRRPRVVLIPTGDEVADAAGPLRPGQVPEFNTAMLAAEVAGWGGQAFRHSIVPDDPERLAAAIEAAVGTAAGARAATGTEAGCDLLVVNAGASAGERDHTAMVFEKMGEVLVHGVAIRPGKPVILGIVRGRLAIGLPGYPVSAMLTFDLFARPIVYGLLGLAPPERERLRATLVRKVHSTMGVDEFVRVTAGRVGGRMVAAPLGRGAGLVTSLVRADGMLVIPRTSEGIEAGEEVEIELRRPRAAIEAAVLVVGSHDVALDVVADFLHRADPGASLTSAHVGSLGGLLALSRGEAHMAGVHLLYEATGEYNVPYVRQYLPGRPVVLVTLAHREQGLMVQPGNPKRIGSIADLARPDVRFVNRQRGAGTRLLLDYEMRRCGLAPDQIYGYDREVYTHMATAAAVGSGAADAGLGILAAARAMGLEFVPVARERFDLAILEEHMAAHPVRRVLEVLDRDDFKHAVAALGGYDLSATGTRIRVLP
ncbi:MAG: molybdopterin biosynthesis protein [Armatimonadetes bacterium]|nr:molybdopterin biosynthesis protein [Armatimonadota bacterium]